MAFLSSMNISGSGMTAQKLRMDIIAENISNIDTTRTEKGGPYVKKSVVFKSIEGNNFKSQLDKSMGINSPNAGVKVVAIVEDETPFKMVFNPSHPDADENGYVQMPNVDLIKETTDSMEATRAYEANITAFNAVKLMASKALEIGR
ncbi:MAG: flagellar basal body rod protein FlgC [Oscillospiraceae bacterium]